MKEEINRMLYAPNEEETKRMVKVAEKVNEVLMESDLTLPQVIILLDQMKELICEQAGVDHEIMRIPGGEDE